MRVRVVERVIEMKKDRGESEREREREEEVLIDEGRE